MGNYFKFIKIGFIPFILFILMDSFFIINEFEQGIVLQFGKPMGESKTKAGFYFKSPFVQNVIKFEKRILEWDGAATEIPTKGMKGKDQSSLVQTDKQETTNIFIDTFARWKITNPLKFYTRVNNETSAQSRLDGIIDGKIRDKIAPKYINDVVKNSDAIMKEALSAVTNELIKKKNIKQISVISLFLKSEKMIKISKDKKIKLYRFLIDYKKQKYSAYP